MISKEKLWSLVDRIRQDYKDDNRTRSMRATEYLLEQLDALGYEVVEKSEVAMHLKEAKMTKVENCRAISTCTISFENGKLVPDKELEHLAALGYEIVEKNEAARQRTMIQAQAEG
jgi:hypothetical protein